MPADPAAWTEAIHPDDRERVLACCTGHSTGDVRLAFRFIRPDGDCRWIEMRYSAGGHPNRIAGVARDITEFKRTHLALQESRERLDGIVYSAMDAIVCVDAAQRIVLVNPAAEAMFGYAADELLGRSLDLLIPERFRTSHVRQVDGFGRSGHTTRRMGALRSVTGLRRNGEEFPLEVSISRNATSAGMFYTSIMRDISESLRAQRQIERLNRLYATLSAINQLVVRVSRPDELFEQACRITVDQGGYRLAWIGRVDRETARVVPEASAGLDPGVLASAAETFTLDSEGDDETLVARAVRTGQPGVCFDLGGDPLADAIAESEQATVSKAAMPLLLAGEAIGVLVLYSAEPDCFEGEQMRLLHKLAGDVAFAIDHIAKTDQLDYLARYDVLTGLANPSLWSERLHQRLSAQPDDDTRLTAVFALDVENFRAVNEALGRKAGDEVLRLIARRFRPFDDEHSSRFCRTGGDRFAVFAHGMEDAEQVGRYLEQHLDAIFHEPVHVDGTDVRVAVKVGVALYPDDARDTESLLRYAEAALKKAKADGRRYLFFAPDMTARVAERLSLEARLRKAIDREEFVLHYQPKVAVADRSLTGCEALIRWNDPVSGLVPPMRFIPVLEQTGLIHDVGRWAMRKAVADYLRWRDAGLPAVRIAVNVSPLQLRDRGFAAEVAAVLGIDGRAAEGIELEITESVIMEDARGNIGLLDSIRALGATIAIDDFGTGFSSLSYLSKLPVDTLKVDRSFVVDMTAHPHGLGLVSTIVSLAHLMELKVVAEGVETDEQLRLLHLLRCDQMQGYLVSPPLPCAEFEARFLDVGRR